MALAGNKALIKEQSAATVFTDEATTTADNQIYQITNTTKRIFDYDTTLIVEDAAVPTTENYTVSKLNGTVTFDSIDAGRVITFTGKYVTLVNVVEAKEFSFDGVQDMGDTTVFQNEDRTFKPLLRSATATISKFYSIDNYFIDMLFNGDVKVIEFYYDNAENPFRVYALVSSDSLAIPIEALQEESINLQITDEMIVEA